MNVTTLQINREFLFQLNQKCDQIGTYLLHCKFDETNDIGLLDGLAGVGLLLSLYYRKTFNEKYLNKLEQIIEIINNMIQLRKDIKYSYDQGIAGYGWLLVYLKENDILEIDLDDYLAEMDNYLYQRLMFLISEKEYDPLYGAVGIGFYFIKRRNAGAVESIIDGLYRNRKNVNGYHVSCRKNLHTHCNDIDFGMAHGIPGILVFMYKCYLKHFSFQKCSEMIWDHINFMISCLNDSGSPSYFRYAIGIDQIKHFDKKQNRSRLGWCYGDLSALYVLFQLSGNFTLNINVIDMLEHVAQRKSEAETDVYMAGLCHGTSGIAHLFFRLFLQTDNHYFKDACSYWLKKTLFLGNKQVGAVGFDLHNSPNDNLPSLLLGISGVGSVFVSFLNSELINWDESIFLS
jgi:hypothetical protein